MGVAFEVHLESSRRMRIKRQPVVLTVHPQRRRHFGPAEG